jgi:hypothetical protein
LGYTGLMNDELERIWKEAIVASLVVLTDSARNLNLEVSIYSLKATQ